MALVAVVILCLQSSWGVSRLLFITYSPSPRQKTAEHPTDTGHMLLTYPQGPGTPLRKSPQTSDDDTSRDERVWGRTYSINKDRTPLHLCLLAEAFSQAAWHLGPLLLVLSDSLLLINVGHTLEGSWTSCFPSHLRPLAHVLLPLQPMAGFKTTLRREMRCCLVWWNNKNTYFRK